MALLRQSSFLGGELDPRLWGRTDLGLYARGLKSCRNFFVGKQGAAVSRPGTVFCGKTKNPTSPNVRLVPFRYTDQQSFVLEFGSNYIRVWTAGTYTGIEIVTPYQNGNLSTLRFAQIGDVLTIADGNQVVSPRELRRNLDGTWTLSVISFANRLPWFTDINPAPDTTQEPMLVLNAPTIIGGVSIPATIASTYPADATHIAREWVWMITAVGQDISTGAIFETLPVQVTRTIPVNATNSDNPGAIPAGNSIPVYADRPVTLTRLPTTAALSTPAGWPWRPMAYNVYRGRGNVFGLVGQTKDRTFVDVGDVPNYAIQPPRGDNPFVIVDYLGNTVATEAPGSIVFFQQRRVWAGTPKRPDSLFASTVGDFYNHDKHTIALSGQALVLELASELREGVRDMIATTRVLIGTQSHIWSLGGSNGPLDYNNIDARVEDEAGITAAVQFLKAGGQILYPRQKGTGVRALAFDINRDGFAATDITAGAEHLFSGFVAKATNDYGLSTIPPWLGGSTTSDKTVVSWCYQQDPWALVWVVRNDGTLLSLTHVGDDWAWARHDTRGYFMSVCAVPEGNEDVVYALVLRNLGGINTVCMEQLQSRLSKTGDSTDIVCSDASVKVTQNPSTVLANVAPHLAGLAVVVTSVGNSPYTQDGSGNPLTVGATGTVTLPEVPTANSGTQWIGYVGLPYTPELELLDVAATQAKLQEKTVQEVALEVDNSAGLYAGQDFQHLRAWQQRRVDANYGPISPASDIIVVPVQGKYDLHGRAAIRQTLPRALTVTAVTRRLGGGDA